MFKLKLHNTILYKQLICSFKKNIKTKSMKIKTVFLKHKYSVHNGITNVNRQTNKYFINRSLTYNVMFKKPLKKPSKK